jgi:type II secretory pathway component GspD/PulD (secretin)
MLRILILLLIITLALIATPTIIHSTPNVNKKTKTKDLVLFDYENEDLVDIINKLAEIKTNSGKKINILFPQAPDTIKTKITYTHNKKLTINSAWNLALNFLEIAGYSLVPNENFYEVVRNRKFVSKNLNLYIDTNFDKLPNNDEPIRYIYYFKNINLANDQDAQKELGGILSSILPGGVSAGAGTSDSYGANPYAPAAPSATSASQEITIQFDPPTNSLILANRSNCLRQALEIVQRLDNSGFKETVAILALNHTDSYRIEKMIEELLKEQTDDNLGYGYKPASSKKSGTKYLQNVRAISVDRTNSLVLMGDAASVRKLKDLIVENLDQAVDSGKSIIHVKPLQYLDAKGFAPVLQNLVRGKRNQQSSITTNSNTPTDSFKDVIVLSEESISEPKVKKDDSKGKDDTPSATFQESYSFNNNLIVSAYSNDWQVLEKIIDEMDQPQLQVAIEVIIADLKLEELEVLSAQARGLHQTNIPPKLSWQSAQISSPILNYTTPPTPTVPGVIDMSKALDADLLTGVTKNGLTLVENIRAGASVISFNDGNGIAYVLDLLNQMTSFKILSQPFIVTQNHKQAIVSLESNRLVRGDAVPQNGTFIIKNEKYRAFLRATIMPNISADGTNINLGIKVEVSDFSADLIQLGNVIDTREITTNANVRNNDVLVLGGLTRRDDSDNQTEVPILSKIPILGNFFKNRRQDNIKRTLVVFISPKLIYPRKYGIDEYTGNRLGQAAKDTIENGQIFDNVRDPVTRFLFPKIGHENLKVINKFVHQASH